MNFSDNIFKIYYRIGRALPFEVRRFPDGRVSDWYNSQSVLVTKIAPRGEYGKAWGYYLRNGERADSHWCLSDDIEPREIPCCGCGGWVLVNVIGEPTRNPDSEVIHKNKEEFHKLKSCELMKFGKYKGKTIQEIFVDNPSYLKWAETNVEGFAIDWDDLATDK